MFKVKIKTPERHTYSSVSIVNFEQVNVGGWAFSYLFMSSVNKYETKTRNNKKCKQKEDLNT